MIAHPLPWASAIGIVLLALVAIDALVPSVGRFWASRPMTTEVVSSSLLIGMTVLGIDAAVRRRQQRRMASVLRTAITDMTRTANDTFFSLSKVLSEVFGESSRGSFTEIRARLERVLSDPELLTRVVESTDENFAPVREPITTWASVLLPFDEPAATLNAYSLMADELGRMWRIMFMLDHDFERSYFDEDRRERLRGEVLSTFDKVRGHVGLFETRTGSELVATWADR